MLPHCIAAPCTCRVHTDSVAAEEFVFDNGHQWQNVSLNFNINVVVFSSDKKRMQNKVLRKFRLKYLTNAPLVFSYVLVGFIKIPDKCLLLYQCFAVKSGKAASCGFACRDEHLIILKLEMHARQTVPGFQNQDENLSQSFSSYMGRASHSVWSGLDNTNWLKHKTHSSSVDV